MTDAELVEMIRRKAAHNREALKKRLGPLAECDVHNLRRPEMNAYMLGQLVAYSEVLDLLTNARVG